MVNFIIYFMPRMFGTSGVRGIINTEISPMLCLKIGASYGRWLVEKFGKNITVALAYDTRFGADSLALSSACGLISQGINVINIGCQPTGVFANFISSKKLKGGILLTGSHMPPERIGIICFLGDGSYAPYDITDIVEQYYHKFDFANVVPEKMGKISYQSGADELYVKKMAKILKNIKGRKFKILVDCGNGTACYIFDKFFRYLGCKVLGINEKPSPLPQRPAEPRVHTVKKAIYYTKKYRCDIGLCLDTDANRALFITEKGEPVSEDVAGAIFALHELKKNVSAVFPINSSGLIEYVCKKIGARLEYCRIGQPETTKAIKQLDAKFSYEESGKYYFCKNRILYSDGILAGGKMLEIMAKTKKPLSVLVDELPRYYQVKHLQHVKEAEKDLIMQKIQKVWYTEASRGKIRDYTIDGLKRVYSDGSWLLIRKSGTEPLIRIYSDAPSLKRAQELVETGKEIFRSALNE
jgi:phosphomannomutase/phosphoglucomutase